MGKTFTVSARKYRPQKFSEVVGQQAVTTTLRNAIKTGKLAHAYLFSGPRGVGKTTCARIFAKTINCQNPTPEGEACNQCESCRAFNEGRSFNIHELDAASNNSVDDIRKLIDQVRIPPQIGKYSVYIIDEVHMLSQAAFNAFLKTLEEPPAHAIFIMATTEKHKILPTILSRCQVFDFQRIRVPQIVEHLSAIAQKENIEVEQDALSIIAQKADGALRDALSIFDQLVSFTQGKLTYQGVIEHLNVLDYDYYFKLTDAFLNGDYQEVLLTFDQILQKGFDPQHFLMGLAEHMRNLLIARTQKTLNLLEVGESIKQRYTTQVKQTPIKFLLKALDIINYFDVNYKTAQNKRLHVELCLIKLSELNQKIYEQEQNTTTQKTTPQTDSKAPTQQADTQQGDKTSVLSKIKQKINTAQPSNNGNGFSPGTTGPSLNGLISKQPQQPHHSNHQQTTSTAQSQDKPQQPQRPVTPEERKKAIVQFSDQFLQPKNKRLWSVLRELTPTLSGDQITMIVMNDNLKQSFDKIRKHLTQHLLQLFGKEFTITFKVGETHIKRRPITNEEKYRHLQKKNPKIDEFRKKLDLGF